MKTHFFFSLPSSYSLGQRVLAVNSWEKKVAEALNSFSHNLSMLVAKELQTKYSPKLSFFPDLSFSNANKINKIIEENAG